MRCVLFGLVGVLLLGFSANLQAEEGDAEKVLKAFGELHTGGVWKWTTEEETEISRRYRWILGNKFIERSDQGDEWSGKTIIGIDPETMKLTAWGFSQNGFVSKITFTQDADHGWSWQVVGGMPAGFKLKLNGKTTKVSENELRMEWLKLVVNDEEQPTETVRTWTRHKE